MKLIVALVVFILLLPIENQSNAAFESFLTQPEDVWLRNQPQKQDFVKYKIELSKDFRYGLKELEINKISVVKCFDGFLVSCKWLGCGDEIYNENKISMGAGSFFSRFFSELTLNSNVAAISGYNSTNNIDFDVTIGIFPSKVSYLEAGLIGTSIRSDSRLGQNLKVRYLSSFFSPTPELSLNLSVFNSSDIHTSISLGIKAKAFKWLQIGLLMTDSPQKVAWVTHVKYRLIQFNQTVSWQPPLGLTQEVGVIFQW